MLTFDTEPLAEDLQVSGPISAVIHVSCDCRDFDLWVRLQDVYPDGRAMNLMSPGNDVVRASYRDAGTGAQPLEPGRIYELRLPALISSIRFARGHRIRAQISASFAPHMSRNLQRRGIRGRLRRIEDGTHHDPSRRRGQVASPAPDIRPRWKHRPPVTPRSAARTGARRTA